MVSCFPVIHTLFFRAEGLYAAPCGLSRQKGVLVRAYQMSWRVAVLSFPPEKATIQSRLECRYTCRISSRIARALTHSSSLLALIVCSPVASCEMNTAPDPPGYRYLHPVDSCVLGFPRRERVAFSFPVLAPPGNRLRASFHHRS
jgi:hypothetical protein